MKYWIIWSDYDGVYFSEYSGSEKEKAEDVITQVLNQQKKCINGAKLLKVISGNEVQYEIISLVDKVIL